MKNTEQPIQASKTSPAKVRVAAVVTVLVAGFFLAVAVTPLTLFADKPADRTVSAAEYKRRLRDQVETPAGEPRSGRNPMVQQQNGLAQAAASPVGNGARTDRPAAAVSGLSYDAASSAHAHHVSARPEVTAAGCYVDYGIPGEQCVTAAASRGSARLTCEAVRKTFLEGVKVTGTDRFNLDKNGNGFACDRRD